MKSQRVKGSTSVILTVFIQDSSSSTGAGLGSLIHTSSIVGGYVREGGTGVALAVDEDVATEGTYQAPSTAAHVRIGTPANMRTGTYELHFHNDLFAAGANTVSITLGGASNMADLTIEVQLTDWDPNDAVRGGMTALPNANAGDNGGLPLVDAAGAVRLQDGTGANQISLTSGAVTAGTVNDKAGYALSTAGILAVWHQAVAQITTASTIGKLLVDEIKSARMAELDAGNLPSDLDAALADTNELQTDWANGGRLDLLIDAIKAVTDVNTYWADLQLHVDAANSQDEYTVVWYKNGIPQTSGLTLVKIQVVKRVDGTDLVAQTAMTQIGSTGYYKYDEPTNQITAGEAVVVIATATIDGSVRTSTWVTGRDSSA